ncbi:UNVERIFIED_CONTAM: hypothetical protein GTU68_055647 [Idotea baltica]|nr:hypothetical protein [Idotea baltica]
MRKRTSESHSVDLHVGGRVRALRALRGLTQSQLAKRLNVSFQQLQKYETGYNRISASTLFAVARELEVHPGYFFEGLSGLESSEDTDLDLDTVKIAALISRISDENTQNCLKSFIKQLSASSNSINAKAA